VSAPVDLSAEVDKAVAYPGDVITFTLRASHSPDISLELPEITDTLSEFHIIASDYPQPVREGGQLVVERSYKLQAEAAGSYVIEPIEVFYTLPAGQRAMARTPKIFIEVESLLAKQAEASDIRDIKPPMPVRPSYWMFFLLIIVLVAVFVALFVARALLERGKRRKLARKLASRPAHEEALDALAALLRKRFIEKGKMREFCYEISEIFRRYIQARFGITALDLTTEEILPRIENNGIIGEPMKPLVREFFTNTDVVKFAKYRPTREEMEKIIDATRTFVEATKVAVGAAPGEGGERA
jgi:hypothetical protein